MKINEVWLSEEKGEERQGEKTKLRKSGSDYFLFSEKGEHKRSNTQDETPFLPLQGQAIFVYRVVR